MQVDLYYTMRSPYCYLATHMVRDLLQIYQLQMNVKPVYPLAVSDATFFERVNPLWPPYVAKDTARIARRLGIPFLWPRPDPIVQDSYIEVWDRPGMGVDLIPEAAAQYLKPEDQDFFD